MPLKRTTPLAPLTLQHQDGLQFTAALRKGLQDRVHVEKLRDFMLWHWKERIKPHFFLEEKILLPYMDESHPFTEQLKKEHTQIREFILTADKDTDERLIEMFCNLIESHIAWEESTLYNFLELSLPKDELDIINKELRAFPFSDEEWKGELK